MGTIASTNGDPKSDFSTNINELFLEIQRRKIMGKHLDRAWLYLVHRVVPFSLNKLSIRPVFSHGTVDPARLLKGFGPGG